MFVLYRGLLATLHIRFVHTSTSGARPGLGRPRRPASSRRLLVVVPIAAYAWVVRGFTFSILEGQAMLPFVVFGSCGVVGAVVLFIADRHRRLTAIRASTADPARTPPAAHWEAGRWDADDRHAYVANLGDDTAYDVSVTDGEQVVATASSVPPFSADRLASISGPPCYVNFCVHDRSRRRSLVGTAGGTQRELGRCNGAIPSGVVVQVSWRSESGEWSSQSVHAD